MADDPLEALFTVEPEKFTAIRDALVKRMRADKRKDEAAVIAALRRPTASVWAMNQVVRAHPAAIEELLAVGRDALAAQNALLRGGTINAFNAAVEHRRDIVTALVNETLAVLTAKGIAVDQLVTPLRSAYECASIDSVVGPVLRRGQLTSLPSPSEDDSPVTPPSPVKSHLQLVPDLPTENQHSESARPGEVADRVGVLVSVRGADQTESATDQPAQSPPNQPEEERQATEKAEFAKAEQRRLKQAEELARLASMRLEWESVLATAQADAEAAVGDLHGLHAELDRLTTDRADGERERLEAHRRRDELERSLAELVARLTDLDQHLTDLDTREPVLRTTLVALQDRAKEMDERVAIAEHAIAELAQLMDVSSNASSDAAPG